MNIAFIIGCARSGTSILGELIAAHPNVRYIFEAHHIWELGGLGINDSHRLTAKHVTLELKKQVRQWFEEQKGSAYLLVEKNPRNVLRVPFILEIFPEARIIHIVRDGRDVACSMVPGCGGKEWAHLKPPSWKELMANYEGPIRCALAWKEIIEIALQDLDKVPHLQIRYEDLVAQPRELAHKILDYLGLVEHPAVFDFCSKIRNSTLNSYHAQHQIRWHQNNHLSRVGRWHENLTQEEQRIITNLLAPLLIRLGYPLELGKWAEGVDCLPNSAPISGPQIICILGMHRSGTSLVSRILNILGLYLGPDEHIMQPGPDNPKGYWEHWMITALNDEILTRLGGSWHEPPAFPSGWESSSQLADVRQRARAILQQDFATVDLWGWKDPRTCLTLPFWQKLLPPMRYVICLRNPVDVARSLERRNNFSFEKGVQLWLTYMTSALRHTAGQPRLFIFYEDLMEDWLREVRYLAGFLGKPELVEQEAIQKSIQEFIEEELQHHRTSLIDAVDEPKVSFPAKALYMALRATYQHQRPDKEIEALQRALDVFSSYTVETVMEQERLTQLITALREQVAQFGQHLEIRYTQLRESEQERERLTQQLAEQEQLTKQLMEKEQQIGILQARLSDIQARITALLNSKSWRLTAPLRWVYALSKRLFGIFRKDDLHLVRHCRLFDAQWYLQHNPDVTQAGIDPAWHYLHQGWREGRDPSPDFSTRWYLDTYKDVAKMGMNPLVHYLRYGRKEKRLPKPPETASEAKLEDRSSLMMRAWRIMRWIFLNPHRVPSLSRRAWDILQQEGIQGLRQAFPRFVRRVQYEDTVSNLKQHIAPADDRYYEAYISQLAIAQNKRGDEYVDYDESVDLSKKNLPAKLIAFYLPQFHPVPENDQWWGKGFTEWTNVSKAAPQFVGHYQPHLPGELGFYDLRVPEVQRRQVELAKKYGIYGFCFYYYWFDGKKLLERPLKQFVSDPQIDLPFCLCWANENWTRRWDGLDQEILIAQNHSLEGDTRFIEDILPYLQHPRYIRIQGRPILLVYRAHHLSDPKAVTQRWREFCKNKGVGDPYLIAVQSFGFFDDPQTLGFDAAVEFPPHLPLNSADIPAITEIQLLNPNFEGRIYNYGDVVRYMLQKPKPQYRLFRTVMPGWDNTPRRLNTPTIFVNNTPELYKNWLSSVLNEAVNCHLTEERIVFINAWNEWAEGNHLEPDRKLGYAYLHATAEALLSLESPRSKHPRGKGWRLLFVSHDAHRAGAQLVLLELIRWLKQHTTLTMGLVCLKGGPLVETFQKLLPTWVLPPNCSEKEALAKILELMEGPPDLIYGNTVAAGRIYPLLARLSRPIITHVHELDTSIRYYAKDVIKDTLYYTNAYITVSQAVKQYFLQKHGIPEKNCFVAHAFTKPAGLPIPDNEEKMRLRKQLGLYQDHFLVMGCGRGMPFRKGADLLIQVARDLKAKGITKVHFYWVGEFDENFADPELGRWSDHIRKAFAEGLDAYVTFLGFKDNPRQYLRAGDLFLLTSREDPFPLVMLEAAECGLPILCFNDSGGAPEFVQNDVGYVVPFGDTAAMADQIIKLMKDDALRISLGIRAHQRAGEFTPDRICPKILSVARKVAGKPPKITIIVPNYNHASYLPQRLESIFHQTFQDFEVILMDDASTDNSVEILKQWGNHPDVRLIVNEQNSGSPCKQWVKALNMAEGELIWIAESDDLCEPTFLESLLPAFDDPEVKLAYSASRIINEKGEVQGDYTQTDYLRSLSPTKWQQSYCVPAEQEINEGLGIKNTVLNISAALFRRFAWDEQFLETLAKMRVGGDWFLILNAIKGGKIYYEAQLLNYHRRHSQSIIGKVLSSRDEQYLREFFTDYSINLQYVIENFALSENFFYRLNEYIKELWSILGQGRSPKDLEKYFPLNELISKFRINKSAL